MQRHELEHVIRAAGMIAQSRELVIIGSQSILGLYSRAPSELLQSIEVDLWPAENPEKSDLIDGCIGEMSPFHETFGYYAHGVGPETAILPKGWKSRIVKLNNENTCGITGLCLHPTDLAISKLVAAREKDIKYVEAMIKNSIISLNDLKSLKEELPYQYQPHITDFFVNR